MLDWVVVPILLGVLLIPALLALFARDAAEVFAIAAFPAVVCGFFLFMGMAGGPGSGVSGIMVLLSGLSAGAVLLVGLGVGLLRHLLGLMAFKPRGRGDLEFYTEQPTGFTPSSP